MNVKQIQTIMHKPICKSPKTTPAVLKSATKSEQAATDYFQKAVTGQVPLTFNRKLDRMIKKMGIKR